MKASFITFFLMSCCSLVYGQNVQSDARFFQQFFFDGSHVGSVYGEVGLGFSDYDSFNLIDLGGRIGFPLGRSFEAGIGIHYLNYDFNGLPDPDGIDDLFLTGRYLVSEGRSPVSVGGYLTLPIGDEEIGGGDVDLGVFGAIRHAASARLDLAGVLGIDFFDRGDDYDGSLRVGGGLVYRTRPGWHLIGELTFYTESDYALLTIGMNYPIGSSARLRPALGVGLDDGAPDLTLFIGVLFL
jgi:hypothetical protein